VARCAYQRTRDVGLKEKKEPARGLASKKEEGRTEVTAADWKENCSVTPGE